MSTEATDSTREWLVAARAELGLEESAEGDQGLDAARDLAELVADNVDGSGTSVATSTVFLLGVAAGRASDPGVAAHDFTEKLAALAKSWNADTDRGEAPNDQARRA